MALGLLFFVAPWFAVLKLPVPWAFVLGLWAGLLFWRAFRRPPRRWRALAFNVGVACLLLAGAEVYLASTAPERVHFEPRKRDGLLQEDADLGFAPVPGRTSNYLYYVGDQLITRMTVTSGAHGERTGPALPQPPGAEPVVFFGCSMTAGAGLVSEETWPHLVGALSEGRYQPINLAVTGYGPHQTLTLLESGRAAAAVSGRPRHAFFLTIPQHATRAIGAARWDRHGPRYLLTADGGVRRDGNFVEPPVLARLLRKWARASHILRRLGRHAPSPEANELVAAILVAARERIAATWPGCRLHVIVWDRVDTGQEPLTAALRARGIEPYFVSALLPGFEENPLQYVLHPADGHANAKATRGIAAWIVRELLTGP